MNVPDKPDSHDTHIETETDTYTATAIVIDTQTKNMESHRNTAIPGLYKWQKE